MKKLSVALALLALAAPAYAADLPVKASAVPPYTMPAPVVCTTNQCTVWYAGIGLFGAGSNVDIIGQGLDNSVFANGGMVAGSLGGQYWFNGIFLGVENMLGYSFGSQATVANGAASVGGSGLDIFWFEAGGSLGDLFGSGAAPVAINSALISDLISLYFGTGPAVAFGGNSTLGSQSFWTSGAGARYVLPNVSRPILLDFKYVYGVNNNSTGLVNNKNLQMVGATLSIPFKF